MTGWTSREDDLLARLVDKGYSASSIAATLGRSRNSVIGRSHRLKKPCQGKVPVGKKGRYSAAEDTLIATMAKEGNSGSQIAGSLGRGTFSVISRARRIGVPLHGKSGPAKLNPAGAMKPVVVQKNAFSAVAIAAKKEAHQRAPEFKHVTPALPMVVPRMVRLADLESDDCRFPIGDPREVSFGFCGHPKGDGPYCRFHAALCYTAPELRRRAAA